MGAGMHLGIGWPRGRNFIFVPNTVHRKISYFACRPYIAFYIIKNQENSITVKYVKTEYIMLHQDGTEHLIRVQNINNVKVEGPF